MIEILGINIITWLGIIFCISQSAMFSGLNLAFFSVTRLRLEIEASNNNRAAIKVLKMREDSNFLLTTILWGNVSINVLLTLLSNSVMAGVWAFFFSTFFITFIGEIIPQAYFSRHALKMASALSPVLKLYQLILYPVAKSSSKILDLWLGPESIQYFKEKSLRQLIKKHVEEDSIDIDMVEGIGAINFLAIDDILISQEGELIDPSSIISLPFQNNYPVFPEFTKSSADPFLKKINKSKKKWVIITNEKGFPKLVMDSNGFLRNAIFEPVRPNPYDFCHLPLIVKNPHVPIGDVIRHLKSFPEKDGDDVIDQDIILFWGKKKQIITGADILGRLLRGIVKQVKKS